MLRDMEIGDCRDETFLICEMSLTLEVMRWSLVDNAKDWRPRVMIIYQSYPSLHDPILYSPARV